MIKLNKQPNHVSETKAYIDKNVIDVLYYILYALNSKNLINQTPHDILKRGIQLSVSIPKKSLVKSNNYQSLYKRLDKLSQSTITYVLKDTNGKETVKKTVIISGSDFNKHKQDITIHIPVSAQYYLLTTKDKFTSFNLEEALNLKYYYSKLMYEFCHQYKNVENGVFNYSIQKLRIRFNIQNKYLSNEIFKFKILEQSKKELKEKSSIYFDYRFLKNKVTGEYFLQFKVLVDPKKNESNKLAQECYTKVYTFLNLIYGGTVDSVKLTDQIYNNKYIGVAKTRFESLNNDLGYGRKSKLDITHILNKSILPEYEINISDF